MYKFILAVILIIANICNGQNVPASANYAKYLNKNIWPLRGQANDGKTHIYSVKLTYENGRLLQPVVFSQNSTEIFKKSFESNLADLERMPWEVFIPALTGRQRYTIWWLHVYASGDHNCANPLTTTEVIQHMGFAFDLVNKGEEAEFIAPPYFVQSYSTKHGNQRWAGGNAGNSPLLSTLPEAGGSVGVNPLRFRTQLPVSENFAVAD